MLIGENEHIDFVNGELDVAGDMSVLAQNVTGLNSAQAQGQLQIALSGDETFTVNHLAGRYVGLVSQKAEMNIGRIDSASSVDVVKLDTQNPSSLTISEITADDRVLVVNGAGKVALNDVLAGSEIWVFADSTASVQKGTWQSVNSQAAMFPGAAQIIGYLTQTGAFSEASGLLGQQLVPQLNFRMNDLTNVSNRVDHSVIDEHDDILNPLGRYFFLHRRAENADEDGLPIRQDPIIRDYWSESFEKATTVSAVSR